MARKRHAHEHPDERWLLTYADMITLLMALFMVLFAMALVDQTKFDELRVTLRNTLSSPVLFGGDSIMSAGSPRPAAEVKGSEFDSQVAPVPELNEGTSERDGAPQSEAQTVKDRAKEFRTNARQEEQSLRVAQRAIQQAIVRADLTEKVKVALGRDGLTVRLITDDVVFHSGEWDLQQPIKPVLDAITPVLNSLPNDIRIEGHTDRVPCTSCPVGNQGLSGLRASAVMAYMEGRGFNPFDHRTGPQGFGARRPLEKGAFESARNRRVEIVVVRRFVGDAPPATNTEGPLGRPIGTDPLGLDG